MEEPSLKIMDSALAEKVPITKNQMQDLVQEKMFKIVIISKFFVYLFVTFNTIRWKIFGDVKDDHHMGENGHSTEDIMKTWNDALEIVTPEVWFNRGRPYS